MSEMAQVTQITVEYRRMVSDGNYGNETYSLIQTATIAPEDDPQLVAANLAAESRAVVLGRLRESQNDQVRYALETREEAEARRRAEEEEWERRRAERQRAAAPDAAEGSQP